MYLLFIFLPLIGSFCAGLFGRKLGPFGAFFIIVSCLLSAFFIFLLVFYEVSLLNCCVYIKLVPWINSEMLNVDWGFFTLVIFISFIFCFKTRLAFFCYFYIIKGVKQKIKLATTGASLILYMYSNLKGRNIIYIDLNQAYQNLTNIWVKLSNVDIFFINVLNRFVNIFKNLFEIFNNLSNVNNNVLYVLGMPNSESHTVKNIVVEKLFVRDSVLHMNAAGGVGGNEAHTTIVLGLIEFVFNTANPNWFNTMRCWPDQ